MRESPERPRCQYCPGNPDKLIDLVPLIGGDRVLRNYVCTNCYPSRSVSVRGRAWRRRGFVYVGCWIRTDDADGQLSRILDDTEAAQPWNGPRKA